MTRSIVSAIALALIGANAAVAEEDLAAPIKALQKEQVKVLTELVEIRTAQYQVGTVPIEYLRDAMTYSVNAQLDAADKPKERIALLEDSVKLEADFLKIAEARFNAGTVTVADVRQARSCLLASKIRLLRERGPIDKVVAQIKALQKERVKVLTELVEIRTAQVRVGTVSCEFVLGAEADLVNAQMDATDKHEDRVAQLEQAVKREAEFLNVAEALQKVMQATVTLADVYRARSRILTTKIELLEEGSPNDKVASQIKALQKEQTEALTRLVKLVEDEYERGAMEFGTLVSAEAALFNAQVGATGKREGRLAAIEEGVKRETDFLKIAEARFNAGTVTDADVRQARWCLLDSKIRLLWERGLQYIERGNELANKGEYDKAIADFTQALAVAGPNDTQNISIAYTNRGNAWADKREYDKAIADFDQALAINPKYAIAYSGRGGAWENKREHDKAIADYTQAVTINPNDADAFNSLGWLYATSSDEKYRDGKKALKNAKKAYELDGGKKWASVDSLAAAYAESGDFDAAKKWQGKAIDLTKTDKSATEKDKTDAASHLESYKQGKPWREELKKK